MHFGAFYQAAKGKAEGEGIADLTSQTEKIKEQGEQIEQKIEQLLEVSNEQGEQIKQMNTGFTLFTINQEKATNQLSGQLTDHGQQISEVVYKGANKRTSGANKGAN